MSKIKTPSIVLAVLGFFMGPVAVQASAQEPDELDWQLAQVSILKQWIEQAPSEGLSLLSTEKLDSALEKANSGEVNNEATSLALRLGRMHLLGQTPASARSGWHIVDTDASIDLEARLASALSQRKIDQFFLGLAPSHPDYAALLAAFGTETDAQRRKTIAGNMERWRWMPRNLGSDFILVNAAKFEAQLWRARQYQGSWRIIVGKTRTPTPIFSATVTGVILNPWWEIPASIVRESVGSLVRRNPSLARQRGYVWGDGRYRQRPGPNNALGQMKLVMPNRFSVYMHDTPSKNLFEEEKRTFSHGCIRVGNALDFATTLLEGVKTREEVNEIVESLKTTEIDLASSLPVYVTYFTAVASADGSIEFLEDVYARDRTFRKVADAGSDACPFDPESDQLLTQG